MKRIQLALIAFACLVTTVATAQETSWFDLANCEMCKNMSGQEGLLDNIQWENHVIPGGMLSIAVIPEDYRAKMETAHKGMESTVGRLQQGETLKLCGFCQSHGSLMAAGAKSTELETVGGDISILTSDDPAMVAKIQAHAEKTITEFKKMVASGDHGHDDDHGHAHGHDDDHGHDHDDHDHPHEDEHKDG